MTNILSIFGLLHVRTFLFVFGTNILLDKLFILFKNRLNENWKYFKFNGIKLIIWNDFTARIRITVENKWPDVFPWNDRKRKPYKESNCFMVPSKAEEKIIERMLSGKGPIVVTESKENVVDSAANNTDVNTTLTTVPETQNASTNGSHTENNSADALDKGR